MATRRRSRKRARERRRARWTQRLDLNNRCRAFSMAFGWKFYLARAAVCMAQDDCLCTIQQKTICIPWRKVFAGQFVFRQFAVAGTRALSKEVLLRAQSSPETRASYGFEFCNHPAHRPARFASRSSWLAIPCSWPQPCLDAASYIAVGRAPIRCRRLA
jgi:hypothetical protein